jgi:hypothetical protein
MRKGPEVIRAPFAGVAKECLARPCRGAPCLACLAGPGLAWPCRDVPIPASPCLSGTAPGTCNASDADRANASLIAAAPDVLAALERLLDAGGTAGYAEAVGVARSVIAKARGTSDG